ncbi:bifunctional proline dehydrogenase/L-glutamate gamma-semialdehyde dehydrogenase PutA [Paracoccaceae bacterium GXU_MW_L88]
MLDDIRKDIRNATLADEAEILSQLIDTAALSETDRARIADQAAKIVKNVREGERPGIMEAFLAEYGLSTQEGVALMCMAEALLRVPDAETVDELIEDKITPHDWGEHLGDSSSTMVNASTWALMLTGRVLEEREPGIVGSLRGMVRRMGEPVIRTAATRAMREMGAQFVLGQTIQDAMKRGRDYTKKGYTYSFDMLGEAARTEDDAKRYHDAYLDAIHKIGKSGDSGDIRKNHGISVKLSALHPRYETSHREDCVPVLVARLLEACQLAKSYNIGLNVDAEEADRLDLSLDIIEEVLSDESLAGWDGFGVVVQAYGRRAAPVIRWLHALAEKLDRKIMVRLVKGAYWDTEIKLAQVKGLDGFPVFTRKANTDVSYLGCARLLLDSRDRIYPQFATHNAHTVAAVLDMAGDDFNSFELQRLHGMGESVHEIVRRQTGVTTRIYAPVGAHRDLLAYLVRRLLENGANSSFVNQIVDEDIPPAEVAADPIAEALEHEQKAHPGVTPPEKIFGDRRNSEGWDLLDPVDVMRFKSARAPFAAPYTWEAGPLSSALGAQDGTPRELRNPAKREEVIGTVYEVDQAGVEAAITAAIDGQEAWAARPVSERADILRKAGQLYEENAGEIFGCIAREAGKTPFDAVAEIREAVDFLNYYADQAEAAEEGTEARGAIVCISPWNFPLAIFTGQIAAALVTGNSVLAKPAEQTPLIASIGARLLHEAGVPKEVLHLLPGDGENVGAPLTTDPRIAGVCFTGSTEVARIIEKALAKNGDPDAMLIAETGGINAMIVDSTALPEQAVRDITASAFQSCGQRCSALRVLYVQDDVADGVLKMLKGAMDAMVIGDPWDMSTDIGPVIDEEAYENITSYTKAHQADRLHAIDGPTSDFFVTPVAIKTQNIGTVEREVFGPVLHVARFGAEEIGKVIDDINARGFGLTFGIHSRIDARVQEVVDGVHAGNVYVNRNQIGAIVGSQPFGGEGLSGTGPKAGGPFYLSRFRKSKRAGGRVSGETVKLPSWPDAAAWAARNDRLAVLRRRGADTALLNDISTSPLNAEELPGPTGESNRLRLAPRGRVLCLGPDAESLKAQVVTALAMGNAVVAIAPKAMETLDSLRGGGVPLVIREGQVEAGALTSGPLDLVAFAGDDAALRPLRQALAARDGAIVPVVTDLNRLSAFAHERAVCIDTTAAGGNAALLAKVS